MTVGMAVDANVLIFERIREELREGNTVQNSIHAGYEKAFSSIADANVTTLIAAIVLFAFGTGPIKGFAVTLSLGIITSMFTAIIGTRCQFEIAMLRLIKDKPNIDFLSRTRRNIAVGLSILVVLLSIGSFSTRGLNLGIDFTGGILLEVSYPKAADLEQIRQNLTDAGFDDYVVQEFGAAEDILVRLPPQPGQETSEIREALFEVLSAGDSSVELLRFENVSAQVGEELTEQGGLAMIFALLMIFAYVMFRFQWKFAMGAVAALAHDVIVTVGFFSMTGISFDLTVVAAVLAVIGYSLNDTVVAFDRIRENFAKLRGATPEEAMNTSINEMLARTIITGVTTLVVLSALLALGGESVGPFSVALIVGIIVGTYSSIYTASAAALMLHVTPQDLMPAEIDPDFIDDLP